MACLLYLDQHLPGTPHSGLHTTLASVTATSQCTKHIRHVNNYSNFIHFSLSELLFLSFFFLIEIRPPCAHNALAHLHCAPRGSPRHIRTRCTRKRVRKIFVLPRFRSGFFPFHLLNNFSFGAHTKAANCVPSILVCSSPGVRPCDRRKRKAFYGEIGFARS
jgi:hypothetical protein